MFGNDGGNAPACCFDASRGAVRQDGSAGAGGRTRNGRRGEVRFRPAIARRVKRADPGLRAVTDLLVQLGAADYAGVEIVIACDA
ncbi:MAG: hypothetical protein U5K76_04775 [Woeseiaceae bacterium]|nr:hypothetical protein [Woeseiaceae bacterium]